MSDTSTSALLLTREQAEYLHNDITRGWRWGEPGDDEPLIESLMDSHLAALDRIEAQETEIGRLRSERDDVLAALREFNQRLGGIEQVNKVLALAVADTQEEAGDA